LPKCNSKLKAVLAEFFEFKLEMRRSKELFMSPIILDEREASSMTSAWTEYLCLRIFSTGEFELFTGSYEGLDEAGNYWNEDTEEYDLPDEINGKKVLFIQDEYVIGGEIEYFNDDECVKASSVNDPRVVKWLSIQDWDDACIDQIEAIRKIKNASIVRLPDSFPEGTIFLKVGGDIPVTISGFTCLCWKFSPTVRKEPPWSYNRLTAEDDGDRISEEEFRKLVAECDEARF
jgi:hypothetical protein